MTWAMPTALVVCVASLSMTAAATATDPVAFEDQFETYLSGMLAGQGGWKGDGHVLISPDSRLGEKTVGLVGPSATLTRTLPAFYGHVRVDLFAEEGSLTADDSCVLEIGALGRVDARVQLGFDMQVRVLQPSVEGPVWVHAGVWDPRDLSSVQVSVLGQEQLEVTVDGELLFSGVTLAAADVGTSHPSEYIGLVKTGAGTVYVDNVEVVRTTCSADFDGDNEVSVRDLAVLLSVWGNETLSFADVNQDGQTSASDLALVLTQWGVCEQLERGGDDDSVIRR